VLRCESDEVSDRVSPIEAKATDAVSPCSNCDRGRHCETDFVVHEIVPIVVS